MRITNQVLSEIQIGDSALEIETKLKSLFTDVGAKTFWHPTKVRIGSDTIKNFRESNENSLLVSENDIVFLDLGPIFHQHEADFGRTKVIGSHPALTSLIERSESLFTELREAWKSKKLTGVELLEYGRSLVEQDGYVLNPQMAGHRLGDFPHHVYTKQKLFDYERCPVENLWVLEIHLIDPKLNRGAFFEDLLY